MLVSDGADVILDLTLDLEINNCFSAILPLKTLWDKRGAR